MATYHILSLDGGGIRGVLTSVLLERLEEAHPGFLDEVDLIAGTSTGGILALGLAAGKTPAEARDLYETQGTKVFADSIIDDLRDLGNAVGAQYSNTGLKQALLEEFGNMTLGDLPKKVLISSFDLDNDPADPDKQRTWKPKFFHNFSGPGTDAGEKLVDVALRTAAAPTYFPIYQGFIDGGVVANNPSMCALAQALDSKTGGKKLREVALISVSTGHHSQYLTTMDGDWGWTQWARPVISILLEGNVGLAHYQCMRLLGKRYHRLDIELPQPIPLDDLAQVPILKSLARQVDLSETTKWLGRYFRKPRKSSSGGADQK